MNLPTEKDLQKLILRSLDNEEAASELSNALNKLSDSNCLAVCARALERTLPVILAPSGVHHHKGAYEVNRTAFPGIGAICEVLRRCNGLPAKLDLSKVPTPWGLPGLTHQFNHALGALIHVESGKSRNMAATALWSSILTLGWTGLDIGLQNAVGFINKGSILDADSSLQMRNTVTVLSNGAQMVSRDIIQAMENQSMNEITPSGECMQQFGPLWDNGMNFVWLQTFLDIQGSQPLGLGFTDVVTPSVSIERLEQALSSGPLSNDTERLCQQSLTVKPPKLRKHWLLRLFS